MDIGESFVIRTASINTYYFALLVIASNSGAAVNRSFWLSGYGTGGPERVAISLLPAWNDNGRYTITIADNSNKITVNRVTATGETPVPAIATLFVFSTNRENEILMEKVTD